MLLPSIPRPSRPYADARRGLVPSGTRRAVSCPRRAPGSPLRAVTAPLSPRVARATLRTPVTVLPARSAAPFLPAPAHLLPCGVAAYYLPPTLSPSAGWGGALGAAERAGRRNPRFGAARRPPARVSGAGGARRVDRGRGECPPIRPSCGACEISRSRQPRPPAAT